MTIRVESNEPADVVLAANGDLKAEKPKEDPKSAETKTDVTLESLEAKPKEEVEPKESEVTEEEHEDEEELETKPKEDDGKPNKKNGFKRRVDKLNKRIEAAEQEREFWRQEALRTRDREKPAPADESTKVDLSKKPKQDDFETIEAYQDARDQWVRAQAVADFKKEQREQEAKEALTKREQTYQERVSKFIAEEADDFNEVISAQKDLPLSLVMQEAIKESEIGPKIVYELAKNPSEAKRIFALSATRQALELGKLEAKLTLSPKESVDPDSSQETKTKTALKPITPVKGKGSVVPKDLDDPELSQAEYNRVRNKQERERREAARR
jgi:hypothetical protein